MCKRPNIEPKVLEALESAGVERVRLELQRITHINLLTFCDVQVRRGDALDWLSWKANEAAAETERLAKNNLRVARIAMWAAIAAAIFGLLSLLR